MAVVRIAEGKFAPEQHQTVARELADSEAWLREPIQGLDGLMCFYAAIDNERGYVTNVSVWGTAEDAHQMDSLRPMLERRPLLEKAGVEFEATTNHEVIWAIDP